jgi:arylsulfatase
MLSGRHLLRSFLGLICFLLIFVKATQSQTTKPNVVLILADNVGYGDLGPHGGGELRGAPTPRTDKLATEGLRLTQFLVRF